jgi:hypothetical protein
MRTMSVHRALSPHWSWRLHISLIRDRTCLSTCASMHDSLLLSRFLYEIRYLPWLSRLHSM